MNKVNQITVVMILAASTAPGFAAPDLSECIEIEDPSQRLLCYDHYAGRSTKAIVPLAQTLTDAPATAPSPAADQSVHAGGADQSVDDTGTDQIADSADFGLREKRDRGSKPEFVTAEIVSVQSSPNGAQIVTLSNGQIWIENEKGKRPIETHQTVTIRRHRFNYRMELDSQPDVTVRRLQ